MADQNSQLNAQIKKLTQRVSALEAEQGNVSYDMTDVVRQNIQKAVIAGTQYLGNISGASPATLESSPSFLQFIYQGKLWNVPVNANITSGSGAPTFDAPEGTLYLRTDGGTIYINTNGTTGWSSVTSSTELSGVIKGYGGSSAPTGYLLCDGTGYSTTTYASLYAVIGYTFGGSSGTFNVPDFRGNTLVGYKSGDVYFGTLGLTVGEQQHTLTITEMPSHTHPQVSGSFTSGASYPSSGAYNTLFNLGPTGATGGGGAHNNVQPSLTANYIIKT